MYWLAHDRTKSQPIIEQLAGVLQSQLQEEKTSFVFEEASFMETERN
jgi:hypothetical protein